MGDRDAALGLSIASEKIRIFNALEQLLKNDIFWAHGCFRQRFSLYDTL